MTATTLVAKPAYNLEKIAGMLEQLTFRNKLDLLLKLGVPAEDIMGIEKCTQHHGGRKLGPDSQMSFLGDVLWCKGCWAWWRL